MREELPRNWRALGDDFRTLILTGGVPDLFSQTPTWLEWVLNRVLARDNPSVHLGLSSMQAYCAEKKPFRPRGPSNW